MPPRIPLRSIGVGLLAMAARAGSPGSCPAPRRRPRPDRGRNPGPLRDTLPPGPPSGPRPGYSLPGSPGSAPDGRAAPARPEATGNSAPWGAPPRRMAALGAGGRGMDLDRAGVDPPRRAVRCVPHCRPQGGPHVPITPTAEAAMSILPVAVVGGQVPPRHPGAQNPKYGMQKLPVVRGRRPTLPGPPGRWGSQRCPTRSERSRRRCTAVLRGSSFCVCPLGVPANPWFDDTP